MDNVLPNEELWRPETHWDCLLKDVAWSAEVFSRERTIKRLAAKKHTELVVEHFDRQAMDAQRAEGKEDSRKRSQRAKEARGMERFWENIQKKKDMLETFRKEHTRKKSLDTHLRHIGKQAEKYLSKVSYEMQSIADKDDSSAGVSSRNGYSDSEDDSDYSDEIEDNSDFENDDSSEIDEDEDEDPAQTSELAGILQSLGPNWVGDHSVVLANKLVMTRTESFRPNGPTIASNTVDVYHPILLKHDLREYQLLGLDWLAAIYRLKLNGILADDRGLGKTVEVIALLAHLAIEKGNWGPHLIVVKTPAIWKWEMEFKKWCPGFKILSYFGSEEERKLIRQGWSKPNAFQVCITSYELLKEDLDKLWCMRWKYLILDDAQYIKNFNTKRWHLLLHFPSQRRLLMTGTPLQNNCMGLWSLTQFLMPKVFKINKEFGEWHSAVGHDSQEKDKIQHLHNILRPFILRRLRSEVEVQLTQKYNYTLVTYPLSERQRSLYDEYMERSSTKETLRKRNLVAVLGVMMHLKKICNHPNLLEPLPMIPQDQGTSAFCTSPPLVWSILDENKMKLTNNLSSLSIYKLTDADLQFSKEQGEYIYRMGYPSDKLFVDSSSKANVAPKEKSTGSRKNVRDLKNCGEGPTAKRVKIVHEQPPIPQIDFGIDWFYSRNDPTPHLNDKEVIQALGCGAERMKMTNAGYSERTVLCEGEKYLSLSGELPKPTSSLLDPSGTSTFYKKKKKVVQNKHNPPKDLMLKYRSDILKLSRENIVKATWEYETAIELKSYLEVEKFDTRKSKVRMNMQNVSRPWLKSLDINYANIRRFFPVEIEKRRLLNKTDLKLRLKKINEERCKVNPVIGTGTVDVCEAIYDVHPMRYSGRRVRRLRLKPNARLPRRNYHTSGYFKGGYGEAMMAVRIKQCPPGSYIANHQELIWRVTNALANLIWTFGEQFQLFSETVKMCTIYAPSVCVQNPFNNFFPPNKMQTQMLCHMEDQLLAPAQNRLPNLSNLSIPGPNRIEYDSGKLTYLKRLLKDLKREGGRVLIFTQMTKMLDILETFLTYNRHIYLRIDGEMKLEERHALVERFNADQRIFCLILSTRSGGLELTLAGIDANAVIFYDCDWNPTVEAQVQDFCQRIGQSRNINIKIYKLVSKATIEENLVKKSNHKKIPGEIEIVGRDPKTALFKEESILELFRTGADDLDCEIGNVGCDEQSFELFDNPEQIRLFESAVEEVEEEEDVLASRKVKAIAAAELAEFDENFDDIFEKLDEDKNSPEIDMEGTIVDTLTPVERYGIRLLESCADGWPKGSNRDSDTKKELEDLKLQWEIDLMEKFEREKRAKGYYDAEIEEFVPLKQTFPLFVPPPEVPEDYISQEGSTPDMYEREPEPDYKLPLAHVYNLRKLRNEERRISVETSDTNTSTDTTSMESDIISLSSHSLLSNNVGNETLANKIAPKGRKREFSLIIAQKSMFEKLQKRNGKPLSSIPNASPDSASFTTPISYNSPSQASAKSANTPEWTLNEDNALLQVITGILELPFSLSAIKIAHTMNWDLAAEMVTFRSGLRRTYRQCQLRYETVLRPRAELKQFYDTTEFDTSQASSSTSSPAVNNRRHSKAKRKSFIPRLTPPYVKPASTLNS